MAVSDQLKRAIVESGLTHYRIGKDTGVNIRTIDRFIGESIQIKSTTLDTLCQYFGLELCKTKGARTGKQAGKSRKTADTRNGTA